MEHSVQFCMSIPLSKHKKQTNSPLNRTSLFVFVVSINLLTGFSFNDIYCFLNGNYHKW